MDRTSWYNKLYDNYGKEWDPKVLSKEKQGCIKKALALIGTGKKVLDVGCYNGYISSLIKQQGNDVLGIDMSDKSVELCKKKGITCIQHDLETKLPFKDKEFDVVFMGEIIEHIFDTDGLIKEAKRILRKDGFLVLTTPNLAALSRRIKLLFGKNPDIEDGLFPVEKNSGHIRYFTACTLRKLLKRDGFTPVLLTGDVILLKFFTSFKLADVFPTFSWTLVVKAVPEN